MKRAVLYARVSGDDRGKDGRNLAGQLEMGREYAQERGYQVVAELAEDDRGASGADIDLPELNRVREMAQVKEFDVLVVREIDRLSRNLAKQLIVEQELQRAGVAIEYVLGEYPDTPEGNLQKHIKAVIAEYERVKIVERMLRGRQRSVEAGNVLVYGRPPYGYKSVESNGNWTLVVDEGEALIVRMIFDWYTVEDTERGPLSLRQITERLTAMGILTRADTADDNGDIRYAKKNKRGVWGISTVSQVTGNETYTGMWRYRDVTIPVPAIIDRETWKAAQVKKVENKRDAKRRCRRDYLLRRRLQCARCHRSMKARAMGGGKYLYYVCQHRDCEQKKNFRADHVDVTVWGWLRSFLADPATLAEGLQTEQAHREEANKPLRDRLAIIGDLLADNRTQLERALDLYLEGGLAREMLVERQTRLEETIAALERERAGLAAQVEAQTLTAEQVQTITEFAHRVGQGLDVADRDFGKRRRLIELLEVRATLAVEDGEEVVYAQCLMGDNALPIVSTGTSANVHNRQTLVLTARLVLPSRHVEPQHVADDQAHQERGDAGKHQVAQCIPFHSVANSTPTLPPAQVGPPLG